MSIVVVLGLILCSVLSVASQSPLAIQVRLRGGTASSGRVEVRNNSTAAWGTVCDDSWGFNDATVVCRMLGYTWGTAEESERFGPGSGPIYLDDLRCVGNETSLTACRHAGWGVHNCQHSEDAGVACSNITFRLSSSRYSTRQTNFGIVQYRERTGWKLVCDSLWDDTDAKVLCKSIGYTDGSALCCNKLSTYYSNPSMYWRRSITNLNCTGNEASIFDCPNTRRNVGCPRMRLASAICYDRPKDEIDMEFSVQLVNGTTTNSGIVQVTRMGLAGSVCARNWTDMAARVVCRQLGFAGGVVYGFGGNLPDLPAWITSVNCTGDESSLEQCVDSVWGTPTYRCSNNRVLCYRQDKPSVSLAGGGGSYGRVQITYDGVTGTVCDNNFNSYTAATICKQLGFADGSALVGSYYGRGSGPIYMDGVRCQSQDSSIFGCRNFGWLNAEPLCGNHTKDASVSCFTDVKLISGDHSHGIAMIFARSSGIYYRSETWRAICGSGFTDVEAAVFCSELGFQNGRTLPLGSYGRYYGGYYNSYYGNNITCTGTETSIKNCSKTLGSCPSRSGHGYASVACYNGTLSTNTSVSLSGGVGQYAEVTGRVVVTKSGIRGLICGTDWDDKAASVVCRQLGLPGGVSYFAQPGNGPYLLSEVDCFGNESTIFDCPTGSELCTSYSRGDAGVLCYRTQPIRVEIVGGSATQGRVEITYEGRRGTICSKYSSTNTATAVCKQLGFNYGDFTRSFGAGTGGIFMSNPSCYGFESSIFQCRNPGWMYGTDSSCQDHSKDLGVVCYGNVKVIRGITNLNVSSGIVQFYKSGTWKTVCADGFDDNDAAVVCRELGFPFGIQLPPGTFGYHYYSRYSSIRALNCTGSETDTSHCGYRIGSCYGGSNYAAVICSHKSVNDIRYNVTIGPTFPSPVTIFNYGVSVAFCSEVFTDREARVACRSKGYTSGVAFGPAYMSRVPRALGATCVGNETDLNDCNITTRVPSACSSSSYKAAQVYCYNDNYGLNIRLVRNGRISTNAGRVEVQVGGQWGTVCDYNLGDNDAKVICKQLGYLDGFARSRNFYGDGTGPIWFYSMRCTGNEMALWNCGYSSFNSTSYSCRSHRNDAAVQCSGDVRLHVDNTYGAIQVADGGNSYELVCADNFTDIDAKVVCNGNGFLYGVRIGASAFGRQSYPIGYTNVRCTGAESSIKDCPYDVSLTYCPSRKYASAACSNTVPGSGYRLTIENTYFGRVKIRHMNIDGYICPDGFDNNAATVICREKGYVGGFSYTYSNYYSRYSSSSTMRWLSGIKCDGTETYLSNCDGVRYGDTNNCSYYGDAAVYCYQTSGLQIRLGNKTGSAGRVEISIDGTWGTMCTLYNTNSYKDDNAKVICRMLNYTDGRHVGIGTFGPGTGPIYLSRLYCTGSESSISECRSKWRQTYTRCSNHQSDDVVICYDNVRLAGTREVGYGRVEVYKNNQWTPVCDDNFNNAAARVVCRKLGYVDGRPQCCNAIGSIDASKVTFVINGCTGSEADLFSCNVGSGQCPTGKYATVYCSNRTITRSDPILRLPSAARDYGPVQMNRYGFWGHICDVGWDNNDANVACKSMGYAGGIKFSGSTYYSSPMVVGKVQCTGSESNITQCPFSDLDDNVDLGCNYSPLRTRQGAGALCWDSGDGGIGIRLVNSTGRRGRLEVSYKGEWGRVCGGWSWTDNNARVACRQLGYEDGITFRAGRSTGERIWMAGVRCTGSEQSLFECPLSWNYRYCSIDAGVSCNNEVRVTRGNGYSMGLVQVRINNNWGSVCGAGWDNNDIAVACKQLGYSRGFNVCCGALGEHLGEATMTNVQCSRSEHKLSQCQHDVPHTAYCDTSAAMACYNGTADTSNINWRLAGGNNYTGEILVDFVNITGRICTDGWDDNDATVVCRSLGFSVGHAYTHYKNLINYATNGPLWTSNIGCAGNEASLSDCSRTQLGTVSSCNSIHSAGVLCGDNTGIYYRLSGGSDNAGRVEVSVNGVWGSVCRRFFDAKEAMVLCKTLGYSTGEVNDETTNTNGTGPVYEANFQCTGQEASLAECPHAGWKRSRFGSCSRHEYDAAVTCYENVKLASGFAPDIKQGPVQVWHNNSWHYVCDTNFNDVSAKTVCRYLGFIDGKSLCCSAYGTKYIGYSFYGNGPGTLRNNMTMRCDGSQTDPMACLTPGTCSGLYASVICFNSSDIISESYSFDFENTTSSSGQIAVRHYGVTGRICSSFWTDTEATVFCKGLNYQNGIAYHHSVTYNYQPIRSRGPFFLSAVNCTGSETSLSSCTYGNRSSLGNCSTADIASAICYNGDQGIQYRIVSPDDSSKKNYGRVEMSIGGVWGTVCDRYFDRREATVFCRQMNYKDGYAITGAYYGQGTGPMWLSGLQCKGTESSLHQCPHSGFSSEMVSGFSYSWCRSHRYDVSVFCVDSLKLNTGLNATMGAVEMYANDKWNTVCDSGFNNNAALVACRTLGFAFGASIGGSAFGKTQGNIDISKVTCSGRESDLSKCSTTTSTTCSSGMYASVVCSNSHFIDDGFQVRIVPDDPVSKSHGFVEVNINGIWGSVCGTGFTDRAANIVCKQKGFRGGVAYMPGTTNPFYTRTQTIVKEKSPILMTEVQCTGNEASLGKCSYKATSKTTWCDYYAPRAGVLCYSRDNIQFRLAGDSTNPMQGRVEMKYDNKWGIFCDPWSLSGAAGPACRSIGQTDGLPVSNVRYRIANDDRPVWFHFFQCFGNETGLPLCRHDGFYSSISSYDIWMSDMCRSAGPASVKCFNMKVKVTNIRLANGPTNNTGRVEVFLQGPDQWGTVCDDYWDDNDATVVCMMLGYAKGKAMMQATYGQGSGPIWMDNLGCKGNEYHLQDCPHNGFARINCRHNEDAGVQCFGVLQKTTTSTPIPEVTDTIIPRTTSGKGDGPSTKNSYSENATEKIVSDNRATTAAITVPIVLALLVAAAVCGFLYYRRHKSTKSEMLSGLVPDIPASSRTGISLTPAGAFFSKHTETQGVGGVGNPAYESEHADQNNHE